MYTAYRLNDPNEVMPPHKHSPSAIRFGLTGKGNFTGVDGENITFGPGDMVLTPNDTWHNHGNIGNEPAINLSVLDLPLVETLNAIHFDHDYTEMVDGKPVKLKEQTANVPTDYSARIYGTAACGRAS
jgi:gentisate 1,2-dioxygenase